MSEQPDNYKPPESREELLRRYASGERNFPDTDLSDVDFSGATLDGANFEKWSWFSSSIFDRASLRGTRFSGFSSSTAPPPLSLVFDVSPAAAAGERSRSRELPAEVYWKGQMESLAVSCAILPGDKAPKIPDPGALQSRSRSRYRSP